MQLAIPYFRTDPCKLLVDLFQAYYDARKNKRNTVNALNFERHLESSLFALYDEIIEGRYEPKPSICFIVDRPVKREIFAADFCDRIIHHLIYNYISPIFEKSFINDSYSCRKNKGTHYGIKRMDHFIRSCSQNYTQDCGLPIGNLTSQLFGNICLNEFDHFVKKDLHIRYYGRYVDDFILIHQEKEYLKSLIVPIREFLDHNLQLKLHPDKSSLR
jgi:retron-type reverse transcriptase